MLGRPLRVLGKPISLTWTPLRPHPANEDWTLSAHGTAPWFSREVFVDMTLCQAQVGRHRENKPGQCVW